MKEITVPNEGFKRSSVAQHVFTNVIELNLKGLFLYGGVPGPGDHMIPGPGDHTKVVLRVGEKRKICGGNEYCGRLPEFT